MTNLHIAQTSYVSKAVAPLREEAVARAADYARHQIEYVEAALQAAGMDLDKCAPYPRGTMGRAEYAQALQRRAQFQMLVESVQPSICRGAPHIVAMSDERKARYVATAEREAGEEFEAFVAKLEGKIGEHTSCQVNTGNGLWGYSILTITKPDTTVQRWKTQQILNVSKLGKVFNQWPTRRIA